MLCENCHQQEATFHLKQNVNGHVTQQHLCKDCAEALGYQHYNHDLSGLLKPFFQSEPQKSSKLWTQLFDQSPLELFGGLDSGGEGTGPGLSVGNAPRGQEGPETDDPVCPDCGMSLHEFVSGSLLGCATCYDTFGDALDAIFRRVQAGNRHVGRRLGGKSLHEIHPDLRKDDYTGVANDVSEAGNGENGESPKNQASEPDVDNKETTATTEKQRKLQRLQAMQDEAVRVEDYEKAARVRDTIKALKKETEADDDAS